MAYFCTLVISRFQSRFYYLGVHGCSEFADQPIWAQRSFVSEKLLCFNCLRPGHKAVNCKLKKRCQECNKFHNMLFHKNTPTANEEESDNLLCDNQAIVQSLTMKNSENFSACILRQLQYISQFCTDCQFVESN